MRILIYAELHFTYSLMSKRHNHAVLAAKRQQASNFSDADCLIKYFCRGIFCANKFADIALR